MTGKPKPTARQAFDLNVADARMLVDLARLLYNQRTRRMRSELREKVGHALRIPKRDWSAMECLQNKEVFVTFLPGAGSWLDRLSGAESLRPLLRQAVVALAAAVETFVADRVMERYSAAMKANPRPARLLGLTMTVDDWLRIESSYQRKAWGLRNLVELEVRQRASTAPSVIGELFSMVGERNLLQRVDGQRKLSKGASAAELSNLCTRRNKIAHDGDRQGRGRAAITVDEVERYLASMSSIVAALDALTAG